MKTRTIAAFAAILFIAVSVRAEEAVFTLAKSNPLPPYLRKQIQSVEQYNQAVLSAQMLKEPLLKEKKISYDNHPKIEVVNEKSFLDKACDRVEMDMTPLTKEEFRDMYHTHLVRTTDRRWSLNFYSDSTYSKSFSGTPLPTFGVGFHVRYVPRAWR